MRILPPGPRAVILTALLASLLLAACSSTPTPTPTLAAVPTSRPTRPVPSAAPSHTPLPTLTASPSPAPGRIFKTLAEAAPLLDFTPLYATFGPEGLPLQRILLTPDHQLKLYYSLTSNPEAPAAGSARMLVLTQTTGGDPVTAEAMANPERGAMDLLPTTVRGQPGFFFWQYAAGGQPSYQLAWREQGVNMIVALTGTRSSPAESGPHSLDPLLLQVASALAPDTAGWQTVTSADGTVTFSIPPDWTPSGPDAYSGADGFARLERFDGPAVFSLAEACEWEANTHPDLYGTQPEISYVSPGEPYGSPCMVRPDSGQAAVLIAHPGQDTVLRVSTRHAIAVARSLSALPPAARPTSTLPAAAVQPPAAPQTLAWQGLSVDIYPLGPLTAASADVFLSPPPEALEKHRAQREQPATKGDQAVVQGRTLTLREETIQHLDTENTQVQVVADGQVIYRYTLIGLGAPSDARLYAWQDQWVLNIRGLLVINGEIANPRLGYERVSGWTLLDGKPFYFFQKDGQVRVSYGGVLFPVVYDQVLTGYPNGSNARMAWFYALKDGQVQYVEMGRYLP